MVSSKDLATLVAMHALMTSPSQDRPTDSVIEDAVMYAKKLEPMLNQHRFDFFMGMAIAGFCANAGNKMNKEAMVKLAFEVAELSLEKVLTDPSDPDSD